MADAAEWKRWLGRVRHDLVKPAGWRARDLRDTGAPPDATDRAALRRGLLDLRDAEGNAATASGVWRALREEIEAEAGGPQRAALDAFESIVRDAEEAARAVDETVESGARAVASALALDPAFEALTRALVV